MCRTTPLEVQPSLLARRAVDRIVQCRNQCGFTDKLYFVRVHEVTCTVNSTENSVSSEKSSLSGGDLSFQKRNKKKHRTVLASPKRLSLSGKGIVADNVHPHPLFLFKEPDAKCDSEDVLESSGSCARKRADSQHKSSHEVYMCEECQFRICNSCLVRALSHQLKQISKSVDIADEMFPGKEERKTNAGGSSRDTNGHYAQNLKLESLKGNIIVQNPKQKILLDRQEEAQSCCCCPCRNEENRRRRVHRDRDCVIF